MKVFLIIIIALLPSIALAQYSISEKTDAKAMVDSMAFRVRDNINLDIKTKAYYRFLRRKRIFERNYLKTENKITISQYAFDNWAGGEDNNFNGRIYTNTQHVYHNKKIAVDTYINAVYGIRKADTVVVKSDDSFQINSDISYVIYNRWNYTFGVNVASQFSKSWNDYKLKQSYRSDFFAPANVKPYLGITYKVSDSKKFTISPVSGNVLLVLDDSLSNIGAFGVEKGKKSKLSIGAFINSQWTQNITKNGDLKYRGIVQSFWDYNSNPNFTWESWIDFRVFRMFEINLNVKIIYDEKITIKDSDSHLQIKESLSFGISYTFQNKNKPTYTIVK